MADARSDVVVIGSCFVDMISYVPRLPKFGETIKGTKFHMGFGGKAANQCVMAQNLGAKTVMIAKLGNDQFGKDTIHNFNRFGVNTQFISVTDEADTGVTNIVVNKSGEPAFISLAGANRHFNLADVKAAENVVKSCPVMVCDKGIPLQIAAAVLQYGKDLGSRTLFNPSPKLEYLPQSVYVNCDVLVLNKDEGLSMMYIRTSKVNAVDTTGAGDALTGALAFYMSCYPQLSLAEMVFRAVHIATITVTKHGVQTSYPKKDELDDWLFDRDAKTCEQSGLEVFHDDEDLL
ncbi:PREDICTED: ribokinase-like isoform X2 [Acropora digitifera]|uniref:ribokinase-like isoform X2 n=1 Tax=Acropora digitifera TaxID=70779 RepID=UPI00077AFDF1|nr:PREDICTED: ribokinase-like isoform X2 [Acropora digitifera]